jgi:hypothetical protein
VIFFTATMRSSSRSAALNTVPKEPLPTVSIILKRLRGRAGAASPSPRGGGGGGGSGGGASEEAPSVVSVDAYMLPSDQLAYSWRKGVIARASSLELQGREALVAPQR